VATTASQARTAFSRIVEVPPRAMWPYALPGAAQAHEARWQLRLRLARTMSAEEHAARTGVEPIEEVIGCSLCGDRRVQPLLHPHGVAGRSAADDEPATGARWAYAVVRCPTCGFLYRHPGIRPDRLHELYAGAYNSFLTGAYRKKRTRRYRLVMDAFAPVFAEGAGRRLLDYGCGTGMFLELAHGRGFDGHGVDLSPESIDEARTHPGGEKTYVGAPQDVPEIAAGGFDVITMWSVLAHLAQPVEDLTTLRGLLAPDGVLLVLTVNANSIELKAHGNAWNGFTKNHLKFFSPTTLPVLLRRAGFGAVVFRPAYGDTVEAGTTMLTPPAEARLRRTVDRGNQGNMLRAVAFADPDGPARRGLEAGAVRL
jgi:SAM-dependent methyltransferase